MIITDKAQIKIAELREFNNLRLSGSDELECYELIESDLKLPADATFTRSSVAYLSDGTQVTANTPRFEQGRFGKAIMVEERTVNAFPNSKSFEECSGQHVGDPTKSNSVRTYFGGGWYGATHYNSATIKISEDGGLFGNKRLSFIHDGSTGWKGATSSWSIVAGKTYTVTVWARANQASAKSFSPGYAFYNQNSGQIYPFTWPDGYPAQNPGIWVRGICTFTATVDNTGIMYLYGLDEGESGLIIDYDGVQVEEKPYATSFIDGTRAAETLTIPTEGVLNPQEGTVECWVNLSTWVNDISDYCLWSLNGSTRLDMWFSQVTNNCLGVWDGTNWLKSGVACGGFVGTWHYIVYTWGTFGQKIYVDGVLRASTTRLVSSAHIGSLLYIGSYRGSLQTNFLIDDIRISNRARTDEEILAVYQSGKPLPVDEWTTYKLDFDDKVRITTQGQLICSELIEI